MIDDGLYRPLGTLDTGPAPRAWPAWLIPVALAGIAAASVGTWIWLHRPASPGVVAAIDLPRPPAAPPAPPAPAAPSPQPAPLSAAETEKRSGVTVVRPPGSVAATGTFLPVPQPDALALPPAPDGRVVEKGRYGLLPRRGTDGARPADLYARPSRIDPALPAGAPRIALFVGGMGLNRALTDDAARTLPPAVTLGFAPYGADLEQQVAHVRELGHEVLLQVPMESFNPPDGSAMPHMLAVGDSLRDTLDNLHWQMSRFVGYAGVSSFLGGKFTGDAAAFTPVLKDVAGRGLFYLDDGTAARNLSAAIGSSIGLPTLRADVVIDALADAAVVEAALKRLEAVARSKGVAIGTTTGLPMTVDHLTAFTRMLDQHGIALVPLSSLATAAP